MAFDGNAVSDQVYDLLNVVGVTSLVGARIHANRVAPGDVPTYPSVQYSVYGAFRPTRTLGSGVCTYKGSYMIVGWSQDDPRGARALAKAIEQAMTVATPAGYVDIFPGRNIYEEEPEQGDGIVYIKAGAIYEIEVTA